jgi:hypothetical protein
MLAIPSSRSSDSLMAAPHSGQGGEDHQPNRRHRSDRRGSCVGRIEYVPPQPLAPSCNAKLAHRASDSIPRRPRRTMSPSRSETTSTTAPGEAPAPAADDACYGYEDMNLDQQVSECTQSSIDMRESTRRKTSRRGSALGRLQQLQIMESDKSGGGQEDSNERAYSTSSDLFFATKTRRHRSAAAADSKWSESTTRDTAQASPSQQRHNTRRMSIGDYVKYERTNQDGRTNLDVSGRSSHSNPGANGERRISGKTSDRNIRSSRSSTRSNPDESVQSGRHSTMDSSTRSSQSNPDLPVGNLRPTRTGRKRIDQRGNATLGQRQDGWNGQAPNQIPDTLTLDRLQGLAQMKLVRDQSKMSLMSKESGISKESCVSKDSQANREYGIPWWS